MSIVRKSILGNKVTDGRFEIFTPELDKELLLKANQVGYEAREEGDEPFGCLLVGPNGEELLKGKCRVIRDKDPSSHGEVNLVREAVQLYSQEYLWQCSAYVSGGPCAMCCGALYWGNIGRIVFATCIEEGENKAQLIAEGVPMLGMDFREILASGTKDIVVDGPYPELKETIMARFKGATYMDYGNY